MSENAKTITFVVVGLLAIVHWVADARRRRRKLDEDSLVGVNLTKSFRYARSCQAAADRAVRRRYRQAARVRSGRAGRPVVDPVEGRLPGRCREANGRGGHVAHGSQDSARRQQERGRPRAIRRDRPAVAEARAGPEGRRHAGDDVGRAEQAAGRFDRGQSRCAMPRASGMSARRGATWCTSSKSTRRS